jgi:hypothetical protein
MITIIISVEWCLTRYWTKNICYRHYPCLSSSVFDPRLSVFVFESIHICICIRRYPYSNSNKNMKTNMISLIFVRIRSDYTPTEASILVRSQTHFIPLAGIEKPMTVLSWTMGSERPIHEGLAAAPVKNRARGSW